MWARLSTYEGSPEAIDPARDYAREDILPKVRQIPGFRGFYSLGDRQTGRTMSLTLWDSEDDLRASEQDADRLREDMADHAEGTITAVERFEVIDHEIM